MVRLGAGSGPISAPSPHPLLKWKLCWSPTAASHNLRCTGTLTWMRKQLVTRSRSRFRRLASSQQPETRTTKRSILSSREREILQETSLTVLHSRGVRQQLLALAAASMLVNEVGMNADAWPMPPVHAHKTSTTVSTMTQEQGPFDGRAMVGRNWTHVVERAPPLAFSFQAQLPERKGSSSTPSQKKAVQQAQQQAKKKEEQEARAREKAAAEEKARKEQLAAEERARKEKQRKKTRRMQQQALLGGGAVGLGYLTLAKWQTVVAIVATLFRGIGGPTLLSNILRTPGYIFGRTIHLVEWDVVANPDGPVGPVRTIKLRSQSPKGLGAAIATEYELTAKHEVQQMAHWLEWGGAFYERITTNQSFLVLPDPAWVVWSRHPDRAPYSIPIGKQIHRMDSRVEREGSVVSRDATIELLRLIHRVAELSRDSSVNALEQTSALNRDDALQTSKFVPHSYSNDDVEDHQNSKMDTDRLDFEKDNAELQTGDVTEQGSEVLQQFHDCVRTNVPDDLQKGRKPLGAEGPFAGTNQAPKKNYKAAYSNEIKTGVHPVTNGAASTGSRLDNEFAQPPGSNEGEQTSRNREDLPDVEACAVIEDHEIPSDDGQFTSELSTSIGAESGLESSLHDGLKAMDAPGSRINSDACESPADMCFAQMDQGMADQSDNLFRIRQTAAGRILDLRPIVNGVTNIGTATSEVLRKSVEALGNLSPWIAKKKGDTNRKDFISTEPSQSISISDKSQQDTVSELVSAPFDQEKAEALPSFSSAGSVGQRLWGLDADTITANDLPKQFEPISLSEEDKLLVLVGSTDECTKMLTSAFSSQDFWLFLQLIRARACKLSGS